MARSLYLFYFLNPIVHGLELLAQQVVLGDLGVLHHPFACFRSRAFVHPVHLITPSFAEPSVLLDGPELHHLPFLEATRVPCAAGRQDVSLLLRLQCDIACYLVDLLLELLEFLGLGLLLLLCNPYTLHILPQVVQHTREQSIPTRVIGLVTFRFFVCQLFLPKKAIGAFPAGILEASRNPAQAEKGTSHGQPPPGLVEVESKK